MSNEFKCKTLNIHKTTPDYGKNGRYLCIMDKFWQPAVKDLSYAAFVIYLFLMDNMDGARSSINDKIIKEKFDFDKDIYETAIQELKQKKYLLHSVQDKDKYDFYEKPQDLNITELVHRLSHEEQTNLYNQLKDMIK